MSLSDGGLASVLVSRVAFGRVAAVLAQHIPEPELEPTAIGSKGYESHCDGFMCNKFGNTKASQNVCIPLSTVLIPAHRSSRRYLHAEWHTASSNVQSGEAR